MIKMEKNEQTSRENITYYQPSPQQKHKNKADIKKLPLQH